MWELISGSSPHWLNFLKLRLPQSQCDLKNPSPARVREGHGGPRLGGPMGPIQRG